MYLCVYLCLAMVSLCYHMNVRVELARGALSLLEIVPLSIYYLLLSGRRRRRRCCCRCCCCSPSFSSANYIQANSSSAAALPLTIRNTFVLPAADRVDVRPGGTW